MNRKLDQSMLSKLAPSIHPAYARLLCAHLKGQGIQLDAVFAGNTLTWDSLLSRQAFISFEQFRVLAENAMTLTACPWLGLEISSMIQASAHGPLGYGALAAKDVRQGFRLVEKMMPTRVSIYAFELHETGDKASFVLRQEMETGHLREFIEVMLLGSFFDMLEKMSAQSIRNIRVSFPFGQPAWSERYHLRFPDVDVAFGAEGFRVDLPAEILDQPCLTADEFAYRNAERECSALLERRQVGGDIADKIKQSLWEASGSFPGLEQQAETLCMSTRTLIRKLKLEHTHYQAIVDEVRKELACWRLQNTDASIERIAESLGFQDTSNFSRVFRRWCACTPSEFRHSREALQNLSTAHK